jgi:desulfoferrodoxin (superoxide reductase-like protein)
VENKQASEAVKGVQSGIMPNYDPNALLTLLEEADLTAYDIAVSESPYSATNRQYIYWSLVEAGQNGTPIPPTMLIKYSEMTEKDKQEATMMMQQQMMMEQQEKQQKNQTELAKTVIAANSKAQSRNNQ